MWRSTFTTGSGLLAAFCLIAAAGNLRSAEPAAEPVGAEVAPAGEALTLAILDFATRDPSNPELGRQIGETLAASLADNKSFRLVDRQAIRQSLQESELNLTGLVNPDQAIKVGKLVGAKLIVTGSAFTLGKKLTLTAKLIGVETTLVDAVAVKGDEAANLSELVDELSTKIADRATAVGSKLVAGDDRPDPLVALTKQLSGRKLPTLAIIVSEQHIGPPLTVVVIERQRRVADPPVQNELQQATLAAGFQLQNLPLADVARLANGWNAQAINTWPSSLSKVDYLIVGESFSEFGVRVGNLISCVARTEINIIARKTGQIVFAGKATARAADLSENNAAKTALEKAGHELAADVLRYFVENTDGQPAGHDKDAR